MKAILEFNLPDDDEEHRMALAGPRYHGILYSFNEEVRRIRKYEESFDPENPAMKALLAAWFEYMEGMDL